MSEKRDDEVEDETLLEELQNRSWLQQHFL